MTAMALKVKQSPMAPYMSLMQRMNREQKLAVVAFLVDTMQDEEEQQRRKADEEFVREFLATPYDNPMTADETKQMIRESHHFGERNIKPLYDGE